MTILADAIAATHPELLGRPAAIQVEAIEAWLAEHGYEVAETWVARGKRERAEKAAEKAATAAKRKARWQSLPVYAGTNVKRCQGSTIPSRGAPYRCGTIMPLRVARAHDGRVVAVCRAHGHDYVSYYSGWGGDPHPKIATVEPEYVAALEAVEAAMK